MASGTVSSDTSIGTLGNLQQAIDQAQYGDTLTLFHAQTYTGNWIIRNQSGGNPANGYITIISDAAGSLPPTSPTDLTKGRVSPLEAQFMAKIQSSGSPVSATSVPESPTLLTVPTAKYWKFVGIEIAPVQNKPMLGSACIAIYPTIASNGAFDTSAGFPDHFWFEQCFIHSYPKVVGTVTGITGYCGQFDLRHCYISEWKGSHNNNAPMGKETRSIGLFGTGPFNIYNNYIEASGQGILFGGAFLAGHMPSHATIRFNTFTTPLTSNKKSGSLYNGPASDGFDYLDKNLLEFKAIDTALVDSNFFQYGWTGSQTGNAVLINNAAYGGDPAGNICNNLTVTNNVIDSVEEPFDFALNNENRPLTAAEVIKNLIVQNNHCTNIAWKGSFAGDTNFGTRTTSIFLQDAQNVTFDHNTFLPDPAGIGNDAFLEVSNTGLTSPPIQSILLSNNIAPHGNYGFSFVINGTARQDDTGQAASTWSGATVQKNVIWGTFINNFFTGPYANNSNPANQGAVGLIAGPTLKFQSTGNNGNNIVSIPTFVLAPSSPFKGTAYTGSGTTRFADPGCDVTKLPGQTTTGTATNTTITPPSAIPFGGTAQISVQVAPQTGSGRPTGNVQLNGLPSGATVTGGGLSGGQAALAVSVIPSGTYTLTATYSGDATFAGSTSNPVTLIVSGQSVSMVIGGQLNVAQGVSPTITVTVTS